jgi:hypothetical protein
MTRALCILTTTSTWELSSIFFGCKAFEKTENNSVKELGVLVCTALALLFCCFDNCMYRWHVHYFRER